MRKTILITGCSSGIGKTTAIYFHNKGWNVAATMRNLEKEEGLKRLKNIKCFHLDVTDAHSIKKAIRSTIENFGYIDVVVNNAAYNLTGPFEGATVEQIQALYGVDVFGVMNVTREILPYFRKINKGTIINISSLAGRIGMPLSSFYTSAKWAVEGFSESLRFELDKFNIKIKIIEPGAIKTNFAANTIIVRKKDVPSYENTVKRRIAIYEKRADKLSDPIIVAKTIYKVAIDKSSRLRYLSGNDAKLFWGLRELLPFGIFTSLAKKIAG